MPVVAPPPKPVPRQVIHANWTFDVRNDECVAVAAGGGTSLRVSIRHNAPIAVSLALAVDRPHGRAAIPLRFTGQAGNWQVTGQQTASRQIICHTGTDETALSRVLVLLSGGVVDVG